MFYVIASNSISFFVYSCFFFSHFAFNICCCYYYLLLVLVLLLKCPTHTHTYKQIVFDSFSSSCALVPLLHSRFFALFLCFCCHYAWDMKPKYKSKVANNNILGYIYLYIHYLKVIRCYLKNSLSTQIKYYTNLFKQFSVLFFFYFFCQWWCDGDGAYLHAWLWYVFNQNEMGCQGKYGTPKRGGV